MSIIKRLAGLRPAMLAMLASSAVLSGCATAPAPPLPASEYGQANQPYTLGVGDKLRVNVYREPELSGEFSVNGTGAITMPLVGEVPVKGMTRAQVEAELTRRLGSGFVRNPSVSVEVYDFRTFSILGEVQRPGNYPAREGTTLTAAIAVAGGYTYRANERRLLLRRANGQSYYSVDADANVEIRPGDTIQVPEVHF
ncbi:polysaccharide biosynthesis/export family protein [Sphingomonas sp. gentR]|uniref:Polysaccharide export outer membrane protein n=2 Tax=Sphingomonas yabuuchiae TaxID=172044 RepID=A0ABR6KD33_9SPHN|nr:MULTISPECIES: polysaccharide biosynthesis/export family protein [Sphingomonas]MBB4611030.1 polysaccharide export outer membrane protein [Sphingomonas yabuuchiae]